MKNKQNQRSECNGALNGFSGYEIDGMEYLFPSVPDYPQYRFERITVEVENSGCLNSETSNHKHLILPVDMTHRRLCAKVHEINSRRLSGEERPVIVALYRKGCATPLFYLEAGLSAKDCCGKLSSSKVQPGEYYLYVGNAGPASGYGFSYMRFGNGYAYRFRVLEHGIRLSMPQIQSAVHFGIPGVRVTFNEPLSPEENWFSCEYYDESYQLIATSTWLEISSIDSYINIGTMPTSHCIINGIYHILLYHNNQPKAHFSFECTDAGPSEIKQEALIPESAYYQLYRIVKKNKHGASFMNLCGCRQAKKQLLRYLSHHLLVGARPHFVIGNMEPESDFLRTFFGILYPRSEYHTLSCLDVWYRLHTHEDVTDIFHMFDRQYVILLHDLTGLLLPENKAFAEHVLHHASYRDSIVVLSGTQQEMDAVFNRYPDWKLLVSKENTWMLEPYTLMEKVRTVEQYLTRRHYKLEPETYKQLWKLFANDEGTMQGWRKADIERWVQEQLLARQQERVFSSFRQRKEDMLTILPEDVCEE